MRQKPEAVARAIVLEAGTEVEKRTPVNHPDFKPPGRKGESGNTRANWNFGVEKSNPQYQEGVGLSLNVGVVNAKFQTGLRASLRGWKPGATFYVINPAPAAGVLERGGYPNPPAKGSYNYTTRTFEILSSGGFSRQAPEGMVRVTLNRIQEFSAEVIRRERAKGIKV